MWRAALTDRSNAKVDFDAYADQYEQLLKDQLAFFSGDRDYFSAYKIEILRDLFPNGVKSILDFGCGVGLSLPHILELFPGTQLFATDISAAGLAHVSKTFPSVSVLSDEDVGRRKYDLILVATVI